MSLIPAACHLLKLGTARLGDMNFRWRLEARGIVGLLVGLLLAGAAPAAVIQGTVANQNTGQFLERATVRVVGTGFQTLTEKDGSFRLAGLPAGTHAVVVSYAGLDDAQRTVTVGAEESARANFELTSTVYVMGEMVVTSTLEGTAYAINQQRRSESVRSVTSVDAFLDQVTGSPGEFLKNLSGLQMEYNQNEPQVIRVRGMDPVLTTVTMDGNEIASSSDSNDIRRTMVDQLSLALIGNVEVFKAPIPAMSANAIGGSVNFNTRSAFDQKGRRASLSLGVTMDSHDFHFNKTKSMGHGDPDMRRVLPIGRFEYSNSFFGHRLGVVFSAGRDDTNQLGSSETLNVAVSALPGSTLPARPTVYDQNNVTVRRAAYTLTPNRQRRTRNDVSLNTDLKISEAWQAHLKTTYTHYISTNRAHLFTLTPGTLNAGATALEYTTPNGTFSQGVGVFEPKKTESWQLGPGLRYKAAGWKIDLLGGFSKSINHYRNPTTFSGVSTAGIAPVGYTLRAEGITERPALITINSGPDPYDLNNYRFTAATVATSTDPRALLSNQAATVTRNDRDSSEARLSGRLDVRRDFPGRLPFYLQGGLSYNRTERERRNPVKTWQWVGPDGRVGTADDAMPLGIFAEPPGVGTSNLPGLSIREPGYLSTRAIHDYMVANPQAFVFNEAQAANAERSNRREVNEQINAAYFMGNLTVARLNVLAGLRVEQTIIEATGIRTLPTSGPRSILVGPLAGVNANALPAVLAKYREVTTDSDYTSKPFPYLHLRYEVAPALQARASYTEAIGRPSFAQILPTVTQNDTANPPTISVNTAALEPQRSRNLDVSLEYYSRTAGEWTAAWFGRDVQDYISSTRLPMSPALLAELELDNSFSTYEVITSQNLGSAAWRGFELGMRQRLRDFGFLPAFLHGIEVWANFTRIYEMEGTFTGGAAGELVTGLANTVPKLYNAGISYRTPAGKFFVQLTTNFQDARPTANITASNQLRDQWDLFQFWNVEFSYRLTPKLRLTGTGRNLTSERQAASQVGGFVRTRTQHTGIAWVFSSKYEF
jgi:TonB-dependent receptor